MMDPRIFLQGLLLGFSIAAPVGPIGVLCIRRTISDGRLTGLVSGLGAATADAIYGAVAAFGLRFISDFLTAQSTLLRLAGGFFLLVLAARTFFARASRRSLIEEQHPPASGSLAGAYGSTFLLTLSNPATIFSFAAIFAGLGIAGRTGGGAGAVGLVLGVFCGSALWWLTLSGLVGAVRQRFNPRALVWVNRISGLLIGAFGLAALLSLL